MRMILRVAVAMFCGLGSVAHAAPPPQADVAAALAMPDRPAALAALDDGRKPVAVLGFLRLKRGDRVLDVMAGGGYYSEIMASAVGGRGTVIAQEPTFADGKLRDSLASLARCRPNMRLLYVMPADLALPAGSLDFVLLHLVYHDTYWESAEEGLPRMDPAGFLERIYAATRPGGTVAVIDHVAAPGGDTREVVNRLHRIDPATVKADFIAAGFAFDGSSDLLASREDDHRRASVDAAMRGKTDRFILRFRKPR